MIFDWTISLGQIVNAFIILVGGALAVQRFYHVLDTRLKLLEQQYTQELGTLRSVQEDHANRIERWETMVFKVVADLQRVIGRMETQQDRRWDGTNRPSQ